MRGSRCLPIRRGIPIDVGGLADHVSTPVFGTPVGLVMYAHHNRTPEETSWGLGGLSYVTSRLRGIFKDFF